MPDLYGRGEKTDREPRCWRCSRMLARLVTRPWVIDCPRCRARNADGAKSETP